MSLTGVFPGKKVDERGRPTGMTGFVRVSDLAALRNVIDICEATNADMVLHLSRPKQPAAEGKKQPSWVASVAPSGRPAQERPRQYSRDRQGLTQPTPLAQPQRVVKQNPPKDDLDKFLEDF